MNDKLNKQVEAIAKLEVENNKLHLLIQSAIDDKNKAEQKLEVLKTKGNNLQLELNEAYMKLKGIIIAGNTL